MTNPYMERVVTRMKADDAVGRLHRHWSARAERFVHRIGYWLGCVGLERCAAWYCDFSDPLVNWLGDRQRDFLMRWL